MLTDIRLTDEVGRKLPRLSRLPPCPGTLPHQLRRVPIRPPGAAQIAIADDAPHEIQPGELVFFKKNTVHALPEILEHPFTILAIDTPRRPPEDVHFVNPADGTPQTFIKTQY